MNAKVVTYLLYLAITVPLTVFVARTLYRNGRVFLHDVFHGNDGLADAVNHLLVVGFYLLNLGYVALYLRTDRAVRTGEDVLEVLTHRVGIVAIVLGTVHLANVWLFSTVRNRALARDQRLAPMSTIERTTVSPTWAAPQ